MNMNHLLDMLNTIKRSLSNALKQPDISRLSNLHPRFFSADKSVSSIAFESHLCRVYLDNQNMTFLQIGANNGRAKHDPYDFIKRHKVFSVLVEPQKYAFDTLNVNYMNINNVITVNAAIDYESGVRYIYRIKRSMDKYSTTGKPFGDGIASFDKEHVLRYFKTHSTGTNSIDNSDILEEEQVNVMTFDDLMKEFQINQVDVLMIDTEGFDFEILKMALLSNIRPRLIKYEHVHLGEAKAESWSRLIELGYCVHVDIVNGDTVAFMAAPMEMIK